MLLEAERGVFNIQTFRAFCFFFFFFYEPHIFSRRAYAEILGFLLSWGKKVVLGESGILDVLEMGNNIQPRVS